MAQISYSRALARLAAQDGSRPAITHGDSVVTRQELDLRTNRLARAFADLGVSDAALPDRVSRHWKAPTSGGSTGRPKVIVDGRASVVDPDERPLYLMQEHGVQLVTGPLYHNAPLLTSTYGLLRGNHIVVMSQ